MALQYIYQIDNGDIYLEDLLMVISLGAREEDMGFIRNLGPGGAKFQPHLVA